MNEERNDEGFEEIEITEGDQPAASAEESAEDGVGVVEGVEASEAGEKPKRASKVQKRIDDLVHKQREAERQRDEYYKVAQRMMEENNKLRDTAKTVSASNAEEMEGRVNAELEQAKAAYRRAYEEGDADSILEAQDRMMKANAQNVRLEQVKKDADPANFEAQQPVLTPPPDSKAVEWAGKNSWFQQDKVMTNAAYAIHDEIVQRGVTPEHDSYYETIDRRMREEFPHKFRSEDTDSSPSKSVTTVVTPGGNETSRSKKVRLSPSQVAVANRLGVPLEEYAKQFVALDS